ncbi:MAG TPA: hypothetical protein VGH28_19305 [Polyangiaceae bacterium]|jgi:hypothetical protein
MKRAHAVAWLLALASSGVATARADDSPTENVCFDAAVGGQKARKSGDLHAAREEFLRCARAACPAEVTARCTGWVADVDAATPSILVAPQDDRGRDLTTGVVRVDGERRTEAFLGKPIVLQPGAHAVRYEFPGRPPVEQSIVVREYEKNRRVVLRLAPPPPKMPATPFVIGGIGIASGLAFGALSIVGFLDRQSSHCDTGCAAPDFSRVNAELISADVTLGVAALLVTIAIIDLVVERPSKAHLRGSLPFAVTF